jgi:hypothetical protein
MCATPALLRVVPVRTQDPGSGNTNLAHSLSARFLRHERTCEINLRATHRSRPSTRASALKEKHSSDGDIVDTDAGWIVNREQGWQPYDPE